ncbi:MAG TPA: SPOR domain-containing protein [Allosphingosinicella sp.]|nr:SPOR domain-containing protein [Allosphingosinicella sp.]
MLGAAPGSAQTATTGAFTERPRDALSRNLRTLAANPKSATALMGAGKAALDLGDPQAALTFFARAEEQMPRDGRVKMWIACALVQLQQPHAALKFFRDAADLGVPAADLARDRGLAHDIAGNTREAQRDYRMALQKGRDDEVTRRLALSMAISGEREPALRLLEGQLLVRDRSAERARALILALTGDTAGATRAVQAAMPGPQAGAMSPFLARLPTLSPAERALAVHLGVFPSDGRTSAPSTYAVNDFASAVTDAGRPDSSQGSLARRSPTPQPVSTAPRRRPGSGETAAAASPRATAARPATRPVAEEGLAAAVRRSTASRPAARPGAEEGLAGVRPRSTASSPPSSPGFDDINPAWSLSRGLLPTQQRRQAETKPKPAEAAPGRAEARSETVAAAVVPSAPAVVAEQNPAATPAPAAAFPPPQPPPEVHPQAEVQPQPQPETQSLPAETESLPAEVRIAAVEPSAPPPQAEAVPTGSRLADLSAAIADIGEPKPAPARAAAAKPKPAARAAAAPAKKPAAAPADPSRVWVQIAGGADKAALPREYARLKAKAPRLLGAHSAWTAPLNATNRLLVGPFAGAKEAQSFVNQLKAQDLSGFAWTSEAGQKVEKLPAK